MVQLDRYVLLGIGIQKLSLLSQSNNLIVLAEAYFESTKRAVSSGEEVTKDEVLMEAHSNNV